MPSDSNPRAGDCTASSSTTPEQSLVVGPSAQLSVWRCAAVFVMVGPLVGALAVVGALALEVLAEHGPKTFETIVALGLLGFPAAYFVGALPALAAGLCYGLAVKALRKRMPLPRRWRMGLGLLAGAVAFAVWSVYLPWNLPWITAPACLGSSVILALGLGNRKFLRQYAG